MNPARVAGIGGARPAGVVVGVVPGAVVAPPVEVVYPTEGTPFVIGPNGIFKAAPNPNAAKLFQNYCFTPEAQAIVIDAGGLRSLHPQVKEKPGRKPLSEIKLMKEDPESAEKQSDEIKARYLKIFHV